jgi:hypothetical protein
MSHIWRPWDSPCGERSVGESDYRGYRIEANAEPAGGAWNVRVLFRRILSEDKAQVRIVTCRKPTAKIAEHGGVLPAIDRLGIAPGTSVMPTPRPSFRLMAQRQRSRRVANRAWDAA